MRAAVRAARRSADRAPACARVRRGRRRRRVVARGRFGRPRSSRRRPSRRRFAAGAAARRKHHDYQYVGARGRRRGRGAASGRGARPRGARVVDAIRGRRRRGAGSRSRAAQPRGAASPTARASRSRGSASPPPAVDPGAVSGIAATRRRRRRDACRARRHQHCNRRRSSMRCRASGPPRRPRSCRTAGARPVPVGRRSRAGARDRPGEARAAARLGHGMSGDGGPFLALAGADRRRFVAGASADASVAAIARGRRARRGLAASVSRVRGRVAARGVRDRRARRRRIGARDRGCTRVSAGVRARRARSRSPWRARHERSVGRPTTTTSALVRIDLPGAGTARCSPCATGDDAMRLRAARSGRPRRLARPARPAAPRPDPTIGRGGGTRSRRLDDAEVLESLTPPRGLFRIANALRDRVSARAPAPLAPTPRALARRVPARRHARHPAPTWSPTYRELRPLAPARGVRGERRVRARARGPAACGGCALGRGRSPRCAIIVVFAAMTRFEPSVLRASAMAAWSPARDLAGPARLARPCARVRGRSGCSSIDPFLLALGGVLAVVRRERGHRVRRSPPIARRLPGPRFVREPLAVSLAAQLGVLPVLLATFGSFPLVTPVANLFAAPAAEAARRVRISARPRSRAWCPRSVPLVQQPTALLVAWITAVARAGAAVPVELDTPRRVRLIVAIVRRRCVGSLRSVPATVAIEPFPTLRLGERSIDIRTPHARDGDPQPHARFVLRPRRRPGSSTRSCSAPSSSCADGADLLDVGGVKAGPGPEVERGRGARPGRARDRGPARPLRRPAFGRHVARHRCSTRRARRARSSATTSPASATPTTWRLPPSTTPRWSLPTFACGRACPTPTRTTTTSSPTSPRSCSTARTGPRPRASTRADRARRRPRSRQDARAERGAAARERGARPARLSAAALGIEQAVHRRARSGARSTIGGPESLAAVAYGVMMGCRIVRVHDVRGYGRRVPHDRGDVVTIYLVQGADPVLRDREVQRVIDELLDGDRPFVRARRSHRSPGKRRAGAGDDDAEPEVSSEGSVELPAFAAITTALQSPPFMTAAGSWSCARSGTSPPSRASGSRSGSPIRSTASTSCSWRAVGARRPRSTRRPRRSGAVADPRPSRRATCCSRELSDARHEARAATPPRRSPRTSATTRGVSRARRAVALDVRRRRSRSTLDDIEQYLGELGTAGRFDLTNAIDRGDVGRALETLHRMLTRNERRAAEAAASDADHGVAVVPLPAAAAARRSRDRDQGARRARCSA